MTVYVCVWVGGCLCGCVVQGVGVVCWRVGVWVCGCLGVGVSLKCFLCVCFFQKFKKFKKA